MNKQEILKNKQFTVMQILPYIICSLIISFCIGMLFYNSILIGLGLCVFTPLLVPLFARKICETEKRKVQVDLKESLFYISASVAAGRSMPKAIEDASEKLFLFSGDSDLAKEFESIVNEYTEFNSEIRQGLYNLADKLNVEELYILASSFEICSRNGGNLEEVCLKSCSMLIQRMEYNQEVQTILSEKKLDILILLVLPAIILYFLNISSSDYLDPLYNTISGRIIMTVSLLLMILAILWSLKIMNLKL